MASSVFPVNGPRQITRTLTNAEIAHLPNAHITIIPAQGANRQVVLVGGQVILTLASNGEYTASSTPQLVMRYPATGLYVCQYLGSLTWLTAAVPAGAVSSSAIVAPYFAAGSGDFSGWFVSPPRTVSAVANAAIELYDDDNDGGSDYTGGNAGNSMKVTALYYVLDTTTGAFV